MDNFQRETRDKLLELLVSVGKIEEHLKDMNGKLIAHDIFVSTTCPESRKSIDRKIDRMFWTNISGWVILSAVVIANVVGLV